MTQCNLVLSLIVGTAGKGTCISRMWNLYKFNTGRFLNVRFSMGMGSYHQGKMLKLKTKLRGLSLQANYTG
jgi:hypothetical protein